jgi:hypothetical protein
MDDRFVKPFYKTRLAPFHFQSIGHSHPTKCIQTLMSFSSTHRSQAALHECLIMAMAQAMTLQGTSFFLNNRVPIPQSPTMIDLTEKRTRTRTAHNNRHHQHTPAGRRMHSAKRTCNQKRVGASTSIRRHSKT